MPDSISVEFTKEEKSRPKVIVYEMLSKKRKNIRTEIDNGSRRMKVIIILTTLICIGTFANSESHSVSTDRQDFSNAIRFVEKKEFSAAIEIFEKLSKMDYPEAQYNLALILMDWVPLKTLRCRYIVLASLSQWT